MARGRNWWKLRTTTGRANVASGCSFATAADRPITSRTLSPEESVPFVLDSFPLVGALDFDVSKADRLLILPDWRQVRFAYPLYGGIENDA